MTVAPVTAAIDVTRRGGLDELGLWHDSYGRFAPRGFSAAKFAALALIRGEAASQQARSHPDGIDLRLSPGSEAFDALGPGPHRAVFYDAPRALVAVPGGRRVLIPWDMFEEPAAPPTPPTPQPRVPAVDLGYVTDTTIPWADRVARLRAERDRLTETLGPPDTWFRYAAPDTLTRLWDDPEKLTPHERRSLDTVETIEAFGVATSKLVAERAADLPDDQSTYDPAEILAAIDRFLPGATDGIDGWEGADDTTKQGWADLLDGIRAGRTEVLLKPNAVVLFLIRDGRPSIRAVLEAKNHPGDYHTPGEWVTTDSGRRRWQAEKLGHVEIEVHTGRSRWAHPSAWARGTGEFAAAKAKVKATTDTAKKDNFEALSSPPAVRAWIETMDALGVDMSTDPEVRVGVGPIPTIDKTIMVDGTPIQRTVRDVAAVTGQDWSTFGKLKPGSVPAKTITAAFAPYPRAWTATLPPQHFDIANTRAAKLGNAENSSRDGVNVLTVPSLGSNPQHTGSVVHEVGHSMQDSVPGLHLAEMWHMISRLRDHPGEQHVDVSGGRGVGFRDSFTDDYSGRFYPGENPNVPDEVRKTGYITINGDDPYRQRDGEMLPLVDAFELFTTGIQSLYGKRKRTIDGDERLVGFTLGMMALNQPDRPSQTAPMGNDRAEAPRRGSAVAHAYLDRLEAALGDPIPAEPGYEMQTPWYSTRGDTPVDGVEDTYDLDRFLDMHSRYSDTDDESDRRFFAAVQARVIGVFEDMERAGVPSPRSPEVRAALRNVAAALPDGVELQTGSRFYGDGPSNIGVPVDGIEGVADALNRFGPMVLADLSLDTVKLTEQRPMFGSNGSAYVFPRPDASSLVLATGMYGWPPSGKAKTPWGFENYAATSRREHTEHLIVHEVGHLIHAETVRRSDADTAPDEKRPAKFLNAMTDDALARLERIAVDHPGLFGDARSVGDMEPNGRNVTHSAVTEYGAEEAAEYLAEAFALAVFGTSAERPVWGKVLPFQQAARAAMSDIAAHKLWADMFGGWPFPGALTFWPKDWPDSRRASAVLAGGIPPGWGPDNIRSLMDSPDVTDAQRVALQAILDSMGA